MIKAVDNTNRLPPSPSVLIVDDEDIIRELLSDFLGNQGFGVSLAQDAEAGLTLAAVERFDVILVDYGLPGMNGVEFCRQFKARGHPGRLVLMTGWGSTEAAEREPSISEIVAKPFDLFSICNTVRTLACPS